MMKKMWMAAGAASLAVAAGMASMSGSATAQENRDMVVTAHSIAAGFGRAPTSWFRRVPSIINPRLSPNGAKMAVQMQNQGQAAIGWIDLTTPNARPTFFAAMGEYRDAGDRTVQGFRWVGNDTIVLTYISREILFGRRSDVGRLVAYNINTRQMTQLAWEGAGGNGSNILHIDHASGHLLVERDGFRDGSQSNAEVIDVDVATGRYTMVQRSNPEVDEWIVDANGIVRMGKGENRDNGRTRLMYRSNASENFRTISNANDPSFTGTGLDVQWISPTSDNALVSDNKDGFAKIYRVNLSTLAYSAPIFQVAGYDVGNIATNFGGRLPIGFTVIEQRARTEWTNPARREMQTALDETFGVGNSTIGSSNEAETLFVIHVASTNTPGTFYLYNTETGRTSLIGQQWAHIGETEMNPVSAFRYTASDGVSIEAILTMPRHRQQTRGLPMVILTHGGPFGPRDEVGYDGWSQALAEMGYVVVQPNYRGSGGYGREFITMGRNNGFGLRMQDDLDDVITHMAAQGTVDPNRVCMMGWSYGGYASARAAQRDPDKYRCAIAGAGVYDLAMMREYDAGYLGSFGANYLAKGAAELSTVSPARNTNGRWAPILIVHGVRDARVPVAQARTLVSRLRGSGKVQGTDFDYIEQPQNTHNLNYDDVWVEWLEGAERWLTRWNPAFIATDSDHQVPTVPEGPRPVTRQ
ncbi:MAG: alpha/beta fold hydrolase [Sphingopyxis sp.]